MEKFLNTITEKLNQLGKFIITRTSDSITVPGSGPEGFLVTVWGDERGEFVVNFGHYWHGHFEEADQAVDWFMAGVTGWARLICVYHWRYLVKSVVELKQDDRWAPVETTGSCLTFLVWWLPKHTRILINRPDEMTEDRESA